MLLATWLTIAAEIRLVRVRIRKHQAKYRFLKKFLPCFSFRKNCRHLNNFFIFCVLKIWRICFGRKFFLQGTPCLHFCFQSHEQLIVPRCVGWLRGKTLGSHLNKHIFDNRKYNLKSIVFVKLWIVSFEKSRSNFLPIRVVEGGARIFTFATSSVIGHLVLRTHHDFGMKSH